MIEAQSADPASATAAKLLRFLAVGGASALAYAAICTGLVALFPGAGTLIGIAVHAALIPLAFYGHRRFAFKSDGKLLREFVGYAALQLASIAISTALLARLVGDNALHNLLAFLAIAAAAALVSFVILNTLVFAKRQN